MRTKLVASVFLCMVNQAFADEPNLCRDVETVYFSCASENKVISICLTQGFSPKLGELTYRYGVKGHTELEFSSSYADLNSKYAFGSSSYAKGSTSELAFTLDDFTYTVHQDLHVFRPNSSGVFVERKGKVLAYKACTHPRQSHKNRLFDLEEVGLLVGDTRGLGTLGE